VRPEPLLGGFADGALDGGGASGCEFDDGRVCAIRLRRRQRPSASRRAKTGTTGVRVRTASSAMLREVEAGRPKKSTKTPSRRAAF